MGITEEGKKAVAKADAELTRLADMVTRKGATKWVVLGLVLAVFALLAIALWPAKAHATGGHVPPVVVKPPVVVTPPLRRQSSSRPRRARSRRQPRRQPLQLRLRLSRPPAGTAPARSGGTSWRASRSISGR